MWSSALHRGPHVCKKCMERSPSLYAARPSRAILRSVVPRRSHVRKTVAAFGNNSAWGNSSAGDRLVKAPSYLVDELLELTERTQRGTKTDSVTRKKIMTLVDAFEDLQKGQQTIGDVLNATWKLAWTTEKETLFIINTAWLFGTKAGDVYQVINLEYPALLENVITFPPHGAFVVVSEIEALDPRRSDFIFRKALLKTKNTTYPFPPFGEGWFETVYVDQRIRIAKDIRGDTLIVTRDGPPRSFAEEPTDAP